MQAWISSDFKPYGLVVIDILVGEFFLFKNDIEYFLFIILLLNVKWIKEYQYMKVIIREKKFWNEILKQSYSWNINLNYFYSQLIDK